MATTTFKARNDLVFTQVTRTHESTWVVKDPLSLAYIEISPIEYQVLQCLKRPTTFDGVSKTIAKQFPEQSFSIQDTQSIVMGLCGHGLLVSGLPGAAQRLNVNEKKRRRWRLWTALTNIFSIRLPGIYADPFLTTLYRFLFFLFRPWFVAIAIAIVGYSLMLVLAHLDEFMHKLPRLSFFFGLDNLPYLLFVMVLTKSIHELGHGLACKHFGVDCPEIGIMLLLLLPAMYCDTTDSWRLTNKWNRVIIGVAGMYLELILASLAVMVWWLTDDNWLHYLSINIVFVSSVSTILFNANPLMRYDGYYVFADILEISNLGSKSSEAFWKFVRTVFLGYEMQSQSANSGSDRVFLIFYAVASFVYRITVYFSMIWMVRDTLSLYGLSSFAVVLLMVWILGMTTPVLTRFWQFVRMSSSTHSPRWEVASASLIGLGALAAFLLWIPLPTRIWAPIVISPMAGQTISVEEEGKVVLIGGAPGSRIESGNKVLRVTNLERELQVARMDSEIARYKSESEILRLSPSLFMVGGRTRGEIDAELAKATRQRTILTQKLERQDILASSEGILVPSQNVAEASRSDNNLRILEGTIFDTENQKCFVPQQSVLLHVVPNRPVYCSFFVDEKDVTRIRKGQSVEILFCERRHSIAKGMVVNISNKPADSIPRELSLSNGGYIPVDPEATQVLSPMGAWHEGTIEIDSELSDSRFDPLVKLAFKSMS